MLSQNVDLEYVRNRKLVRLLGFYFVLQLFFNDVSNILTIPSVINIRPDRLFFMFFLILFLKHYRIVSRKIPIHRVEIAMMMFFLVLLFSCIISGSISHPQNRHISTIFSFAVIPMLLFMACRRMGFERISVGRLFFMLIMIGLYLGLTGVFEHYEISALVFPSYIMDPGMGIHFGRARGPFVQAAVLGSVLSVLFVVMLFYIEYFNNRLAYLMVSLLMLTTIYFSYTRSAWLQVATSMGVIFLFEPKVRKLFCVIGFLFIVFYVSGIMEKFSMESGTLFSKRQGPIDDRINIMFSSLNMFKDKPFMGFGYGKFGEYAYTDKYFKGVKGIPLRGEGEGNHNVILGLLSEVGLIGTIPYLLIFYYFVRVSLSLLNRSKRGSQFERGVGTMNIAIVIGYFISIQFYDPRFFGMLNGLVFTISALTFSVSERQHSEEVGGNEELDLKSTI